MKGPSYEYPMYFGATPDVFKKAKELRKLETETERILWSKLSKNQIFGLQFRKSNAVSIKRTGIIKYESNLFY